MFFGKAKTHLLKNAEILHSAASGEIPTKLTNTTETFKITQCKGVKLEEKRTFGLTDLLFLHASQIRVFHLPRLIPTQQWELLLKNLFLSLTAQTFNASFSNLPPKLLPV